MVQTVFKHQVEACFTVAVPFHHNDAIVQGSNLVVVSVVFEPALAVAKLLPIPLESDAIAV